MSKKKLLTVVPFLLLAGGANAADSADLKVTGKLMNGSCTPTLENNGVVDFGHIPMGNLNKTNTNQLGSKPIALTIDCSNLNQIGWTMNDNRADSVANVDITDSVGPATETVQKFGLGKTAGAINIGAWFVRIKDTSQYDGIDGRVLYNDGMLNYNPGSNWAGSGNVIVKNNGSRGISIGQKNTTLPIAANKFSYTLNVSAAIQGSDTLAITDNTNLDGSATISLVYL